MVFQCLSAVLVTEQVGEKATQLLITVEDVLVCCKDFQHKSSTADGVSYCVIELSTQRLEVHQVFVYEVEPDRILF